MIDMGDVVQKILEIFKQMSLALRFMALLSFFSGLVVLYSIANHQAVSRSQESNLWKVLGAGFGDIQSIVGVEFIVLGLISAVLGVVLSYVITWILVTTVFDADWLFSWSRQLISIGVTTGLSLLTGWLATRRVLAGKPIALLQEGS